MFTCYSHVLLNKKRPLASQWPTCVAEGIITGLRKWVSSLICVQVNSPHPQKTTPALGPADVNGITDTPVSQPASVTDIHPTLPGQVQLTSVGQLSSSFRACHDSLREGELFSRGSVENSPYIGKILKRIDFICHYTR